MHISEQQDRIGIKSLRTQSIFILIYCHTQKKLFLYSHVVLQVFPINLFIEFKYYYDPTNYVVILKSDQPFVATWQGLKDWGQTHRQTLHPIEANLVILFPVPSCPVSIFICCEYYNRTFTQS